MKNMPNFRFEGRQPLKQRGVVLFITLVALLAMSLAAVALIRSVDTSTLIAGNLAYKQSALASANRALETANSWLATTRANNSAIDVVVDPGLLHPFNNDNGAAGYYSGLNPSLSLVDHTLPYIGWTDADSMRVADPYGNEVRYVIQRMCRLSNKDVKNAQCLFSALQGGGNESQGVKLPENVCSGAGCPQPGQTPQLRITVKTLGPRYTVSYVQAFVN